MNFTWMVYFDELYLDGLFGPNTFTSSQLASKVHYLDGLFGPNTLTSARHICLQ